MMRIAIIKNGDNSFEHLYRYNDQLIGFHISESGVSVSDKSYINAFLSKFKYNKNCEYLTKFEDFDVYYNNETGLKHFLSSGIENYQMLFEYNGKDAILYNEKEGLKSYVKSFITGGLCAIILCSGFTFLMQTSYDMNANFSAYTSHSLSDLKSLHEYEPISYEEAISDINSSNFPDEIKEVIANENFLKLIFSYYKGTALEYTARLKFQDIKLEDIPETYRYYNSVNGYYDSMTPNIIYLKENTNSNKTQIMMHELVHLLQAEGSPYTYINEAIAELMASELLDSQPFVYIDAVNNLKLLISIIGPEPIYELSFGGDDNKINDILKEYLPYKDIIKLKYYFKTQNTDVNSNTEMNAEIQNILYELYKNKYGYDIREDKNIVSASIDKQSVFGNNAIFSDKRKFLLPLKMHDVEQLEIINPDNDMLVQKGLLNKKTGFQELTKITSPTYAMFLNSKDIEWKETYNDDKYISGKIISNGDKSYYKHLKTPIKKEDYEFFSFRALSGETYSIKDAIDKGYISAYKITYYKDKVNDNCQEYTYYIPARKSVNKTNDGYIITLEGIKSKFIDQYDNLINRINNESYHK